jgi:hypothetical protein
VPLPPPPPQKKENESIIIYDAFRYKLSHIHNFMYKRFFIDCSQREPTLTLSIRINTGSLYRSVSINHKRDKDNKVKTVTCIPF